MRTVLFVVPTCDAVVNGCLAAPLKLGYFLWRAQKCGTSTFAKARLQEVGVTARADGSHTWPMPGDMTGEEHSAETD